MEIQNASLLDLGALRKLEKACFEKDAWPLLDLIAVLSWPDIIRLKAMEDDVMIGFVAGEPRTSQKEFWIATIAVDPRYQRRGIGRELLRACEARAKIPRDLNRPTCVRGNRQSRCYFCCQQLLMR